MVVPAHRAGAEEERRTPRRARLGVGHGGGVGVRLAVHAELPSLTSADHHRAALVPRFCRTVAGTGPFLARPLVSCYSLVDGGSERPDAYTLHVPVRNYVENDQDARTRAVRVMRCRGHDPVVLDRALAAVTRRRLDAGVGLISYRHTCSRRAVDRVPVGGGELRPAAPLGKPDRGARPVRDDMPIMEPFRAKVVEPVSPALRTTEPGWLIKRAIAVPGDAIPRGEVAALWSYPGSRVPGHRLVVSATTPTAATTPDTSAT